MARQTASTVRAAAFRRKCLSLAKACSIGFVQARGGWVVSVPGAADLRFEALPGSPLPGQLIALGYIVTKIRESERILPHAVQQRFEIAADGTLIAPTEGSSKPVSVQVTNAGIATVEEYDLRLS